MSAIIIDNMDIKRTDNSNRKGFTLAELIIVVAVIAVLVAISVPIFLRHLEKSREATDLANVRAAYAKLMTSIAGGDQAYTGTGLEQVDGTYKITVEPLSQKKTGWQMDIDDVELGGVPSEDWVGQPVKEGSGVVIYDPRNETVIIKWQGGFNFSSNKTLIDSDVWYQDTAERQSAYEKLHEVPNEDRLSSDKNVLKSIASYFNGKTSEEVLNILGQNRYNKIVNSNGNTVLFEYGQDGGGSVRFSNFDTSYQPYLAGTGFNSRVYSNPGGTKSSTGDNEFTTSSRGFNYVDRYLFTSDEMIGKKYAKQNLKQVNIKFKVADGKVYGTEVWVDGVKDLNSK